MAISEDDEKDRRPHCVTRRPLLGLLESCDALFVTQVHEKPYEKSITWL